MTAKHKDLITMTKKDKEVMVPGAWGGKCQGHAALWGRHRNIPKGSKYELSRYLVGIRARKDILSDYLGFWGI